MAYMMFLLLVKLISLGSASAADFQNVGIITMQSGNATIERDGHVLATVRTGPVFQDDVISISENGKGQVLFTDQSVLKLGPNSELIIDKFIYDSDKEDFQSIDMIKGIFKFVSGAIAKEVPENVIYKTPYATIGIRGSSAVVSIESSGRTLIALTSCCIDVGTQAGSVALETPGFFTEVTSSMTQPTTPAKLAAAEFKQLQSGFGAVDSEDNEKRQPDAAPEKQSPRPSRDDGGEQQGMINEVPRERVARLPTQATDALIQVESAIETDRERALSDLRKSNQAASSDETVEGGGPDADLFSFSEYGSNQIWIQSGDDAERVRAEVQNDTNSTNEFLKWGKWEGLPPTEQSEMMDTVVGYVTTASRLQNIGPNDSLLGDILYEGSVHGQHHQGNFSMKANFQNMTVFDFTVDADRVSGPGDLGNISLQQSSQSTISGEIPKFDLNFNNSSSGGVAATGRGWFFGPDANATGGFIFYEGVYEGNGEANGLNSGTLTFEGTR